MYKGVYFKQKQEKLIFKTDWEKNNEYRMEMFSGVCKRSEIAKLFGCLIVFFLKRK